MSQTPITLVSESVADTLAIGRRLGAALAAGDVIALVGPLGAGKTHLTKGIAEGAGVADAREVNSPTFVLVNEYAARLPIYHVDAYRLSGEEELAALGFAEMCSGAGAVIVEWADRVPGVLPADHLHITIHVADAERREFAIAATGQQSIRLANAAAGDHDQS